ncbi:MAG: prephenate dehydrogenase/arogenate dehydrogenase family protein [Chloroflexi bacterium]|nr:prephenate dehydrogenase/arogenate dehydrogenase family protein [Chloroflexota bacterium]MBU1747666.1 prephenate dehydrogenase/arogenate dehydrogenase family protein [Chloroflexota bacterium]MBU1877612.1 prephenate dehydrogenase/arogenate dehydrogenase family protein [Chloroflexota bacterium]
MPRITIIGTGLIGASIGLGLKKVGTKAEIVGHDRDQAIAKRAQKLGALDRVDWNLPSALVETSLAIIATPLSAVHRTLEVIGQEAPAGCVVTDTARAKVPVLAWADELLPDHMSFVGGHPLIRRAPVDETVEGASADLFDELPYCICPSPRADEDAVRLVSDLVGGLGARCFFLDPAEHDGLAAAVNHLPLVMASALVEMLVSHPAWRDLGQFVTYEFERDTYSAGTEPSESLALLLGNRENLVRWIDDYMAQLQAWRDRLAAGEPDDLGAVLPPIHKARERWLRGEVEETEDFMPRYGLGGALKRAFLGNLFQQDERQQERDANQPS